ncbi:queuine tRNA-ribosyltransferase family protein [Patescibacteria group bacterium]|nr:queuine tRNA-ribosyltransferase family protein [Patescibacteria group bacterium]
MSEIQIKNKNYQLPMFLPDATLGVARSLDSLDLANVGLNGVMVNTYHLIQKPGEEILQKVGGIKKMMNWSGFISSDSGGFQLFSLIQKNPNLGKITDEGIVLYTGPKKQKKILFTPEDSIRMQFVIGSDVMICLDDFTPPEANEKRIEESVLRTIAWAKRAKIEFEKQLKKHGFDENNRPLLLAPIQGHDNEKWRAYCASELKKIGFDIYGLGGWPFQKDGKFDYSFCQKNAELTDKNSLRFALGVGSPENIVRLFFMGYQFFDCVLPTRDARHQRLYVFKIDPENLDRKTLEKMTEENRLDEVFDHLYIGKGQFDSSSEAISDFCDCPICRKTAGTPQVNKAYLHHLFKIGDGSAFRLASLHNLRTYSQLMEILRR